MGKKTGKKRKRSCGGSGLDTDLFSLTGFSATTTTSGDNSRDDFIGNSLEGCLDQMMTQSERVDDPLASPSSSKSDKLQKAVDHARGKDENDVLWDRTARFSHLGSEQSNRSKAWVLELQRWANKKSTQYPSGLLPHFDTELSRHFTLSKLSGYLLEEGQVKMPTFERWLIDARLESQQEPTMEKQQPCQHDPILPSLSELSVSSSDACCRLVEEVDEALNDSSNNSRERRVGAHIVRELLRRTNAASQELVSLSKRNPPTQCPFRKGDRIAKEEQEDGQTIALLYHRKSWKKPYCIKVNKAHYMKLLQMFQNVHDISIAPDDCKKAETKAFHLILMCMLLRYSSLSGGQLLTDLRGGGMQGSIPPRMFTTLAQFMNDSKKQQKQFFECFASPFNAFYGRYGSAFSSDLDWHFGSVGDFFDLPLKKGYYEVNPPFCPGLMLRMARRLEDRIRAANKTQKKLVFCVIVPTVNRQESSAGAKASSVPAAQRFALESFEKLSELANHHVVLKSREHGYVEGAQHLRPTRHKQSQYDTSVFLICSQKEASARNGRNEQSFEKRIRTAFASQHEGETHERRKQKKK